MSFDRKLRDVVSYRFGRDKTGSPLCQVCYKGRQVATLAVPPYDSDIESAQKFIYAVVRAYIRMMNPGK